MPPKIFLQVEYNQSWILVQQLTGKAHNINQSLSQSTHLIPEDEDHMAWP